MAFGGVSGVIALADDGLRPRRAGNLVVTAFQVNLCPQGTELSDLAVRIVFMDSFVWSVSNHN